MTSRPSEHYSKAPEKYDKETKLENLPERFRELLEKFCSLVRDEGEVLDVGCGPGRDTEFFQEKGLNATRIDIAEGMIEYAEKNSKGDFRVMDMRSLDFEKDKFDGIWCCASIFFVPPEEMKEITEELSRVIKDNGIAFIGFKLGEGIEIKEEWNDEITQYHVKEEQAIEILRDSGWEIIDSSSNSGKDGQHFGNFFCRPT